MKNPLSRSQPQSHHVRLFYQFTMIILFALVFCGCRTTATQPRGDTLLIAQSGDSDATGSATKNSPAFGDGKKKWLRENYSSVTLANFRKNPLFLEQIDFANIDYPRIDAVIFFVTNEIRAKNNLTFLPYAEELERSAFHHAKRMTEKRFFSHTDTTDAKRSSPSDRGRLAGIANPHLAENIAETFGIAYTAGKSFYPRQGKPGSFSYSPNGPLILPHTYLSFADDLLKIWMNSSGHRANILSQNALSLGCGAYFYYDKSSHSMPKFNAVQNFQWFEEIKQGPVTDQSP
jgi:uncharacterized protein YkwD